MGREQMIVRIPTVLRSYTSGRETVEIAAPPTLGAAVDALDARFPGLRFRIVDEQHAVRPHIKLFIDGALLRDLSSPIPEARELMIVGALSGG
jgi:sulfur-carrier protein